MRYFWKARTDRILKILVDHRNQLLDFWEIIISGIYQESHMKLFFRQEYVYQKFCFVKITLKRTSNIFIGLYHLMRFVNDDNRELFKINFAMFVSAFEEKIKENLSKSFVVILSNLNVRIRDDESFRNSHVVFITLSWMTPRNIGNCKKKNYHHYVFSFPAIINYVCIFFTAPHVRLVAWIQL